MVHRFKQSPVSGCLVRGLSTDEELVVALLPVVAIYISRSLRRKLIRRLRQKDLSYANALLLIEYHLDDVASRNAMWFGHNPNDVEEIGFYEDTLFK
jgi:hypothetical protein